MSNPIDGGAGASSARTTRTISATDDPAVVALTVDGVKVEPSNAGAAVEAWGDGAGAPKELAAAYADGAGGAVEVDGKTNWVADCNLSAPGDTPVPSIEIQIQVSVDGTNYRTVQTKAVVSTGVITLADGEYTKATGGAVVSFAFDFNTKGASHFKVRAKSTGGDPNNSLFYVQVRGAGV